MTDKMKSFVKGLLLGMVGRPLPLPLVAESASLYLYGTQSDSGTIGLRSGESVTLYDGAVLPALPEWDRETYPYALIKDGTYLYAFSSYSYNYSDGPFITANAPKKVWELENAEWVELTNYVNTSVAGNAYFSNLVWSNLDILNEDGTVYLAASDPVPVTGLVGYSYNGIVLPALPERDKETYPYAALFYNKLNRSYLLVCLQETAFYFEGRSGYIFFGGQSDGVTVPAISTTVADDQWNAFTYISNANVPVIDSSAAKTIWSNFDMVYNDTLYLAASDPVPVYE